MTTRSKTQGKGSVSQQADLDAQSQGTSLSPEEEHVRFKLALEEALGNPRIQAKLKATVKASNQDLLDVVSSLPDEVRSLRAALADRETTIAALQSKVQVLQDEYDALEQYGRCNGLRISGILEWDNEDTTTAIVNLANEVLKVEPPLQRVDISISHRLKKPCRAKPEEPAPIIVRFLRRTDENWVIREWKELKVYNEDRDIKIYVNEDLTTRRAKLFATWEHYRKRDYLSKHGLIMETSR